MGGGGRRGGGGWLLEGNIIIKMYKFRSHKYKNKCEDILVIYSLKNKIPKSSKKVGPSCPKN